MVSTRQRIGHLCHCALGIFIPLNPQRTSMRRNLHILSEHEKTKVKKKVTESARSHRVEQYSQDSRVEACNLRLLGLPPQGNRQGLG